MHLGFFSFLGCLSKETALALPKRETQRCQSGLVATGGRRHLRRTRYDVLDSLEAMGDANLNQVYII